MMKAMSSIGAEVNDEDDGGYHQIEGALWRSG